MSTNARNNYPVYRDVSRAVQRQARYIKLLAAKRDLTEEQLLTLQLVLEECRDILSALRRLK